MSPDWLSIALLGFVLIVLALAAVAGGRLAARLFMHASGQRDR